jgi:short-subunit dehydrogenase
MESSLPALLWDSLVHVGENMKPTLKPLSQQTIVITGASSGIGLATAQQAAEAGAQVVLASRNETALAKAVEQITSKGGKAHFVVTDVSKHEDIENLANKAIELFGGFDTWVNNAGLGLWGRLDEVTDADHRQLFDINFWGIVYGSTTALRTLKQHGGALINLGSVASDFAFPMQSMYSVTKHAIKGFTDALRREQMDEKSPVSITLIQPASIGTPFHEHAKNYTGKAKKLPPPVYAPEDVARAILYASENCRRSIHVGGSGKLMSIAEMLIPSLIDRASTAMIKSQFQDGPENTVGQDNLWQAGQDGNVRGSHASIRRSAFTAANINPGLTVGLVGLVGLGVGLACAQKYLR